MLVRIKKATANVMQSASAPSCWQIDFERNVPRWREPLMGWTAAADSLSSLRGRLRFDTLEQAQAFVKARGWTCVIDAAQERIVRPRSYVDNFNPDRRRSTR